MQFPRSTHPYIPTDEGWLYLAGHKDICSGEIVGYAMGARMTKSMVSDSLFRVVARKRPVSGLIHHSDRGSQYCAQDYRKLLEQFGMKASMSRHGNCYDNAAAESFFQQVYDCRYVTGADAQQSIFDYIEMLYNR